MATCAKLKHTETKLIAMASNLLAMASNLIAVLFQRIGILLSGIRISWLSDLVRSPVRVAGSASGARV